MAQDLTRGNPLKGILKFAVPLFIGNFFQLLYNVGDMAVVGRTLGEKALAAVGACGAPLYLILGFFWGLTGGLSVIIAQRFGAKDYTGVRRSIAASFLICTGAAVVISILTSFFCRTILGWMNMPEEIWSDSCSYMFSTLLLLVTTAWACMFCAALRALGDSRTPLMATTISCFCNIGLDLLFICVFHWGIIGAAVATQLSHLITVLICFSYGYHHYPQFRPHKSHWRLNFSLGWMHCRIALPMAFQHSVIGIGLIVLQRVFNGFGSTAVAAVAAANRIEQIAAMPIFGYGLAMVTFAGQNFGANRMDRVRTGVRQSVILMIVFCAVMWVVLQLLRRPLTGIFLDSPSEELQAYMKTYLLIETSFYIPLSMIALFRNVLQGLSCAKIALLAAAVELALRCCCAPIFARHFGFAGCSFADITAWIGASVILMTYYRIFMRRHCP